MKISTKQQEYLEVIYELSRDGDHQHAHAKNIAEKLKIKMASVTDVMRTLSDLGLIHYEARRAVTLTEEGERIAEELHRRHTILADFFEKVLGTTHDRAQNFACEIEHLIDNPLAERFSHFIEFISKHPEILTDFHEKYPPSN